VVVVVIEEGTEGVPIVIDFILTGEVCPQVLVYVTEMLPPVKPAANVTLMLSEVDEPDAFAGNVQL
jgi:hypothetical protein